MYLHVSAWFIAVQTLMTFAIVCEFLGLAIFPLAGGESENTRIQTVACILTGFKSKKPLSRISFTL